jgi:hypothetical protein
MSSRCHNCNAAAGRVALDAGERLCNVCQQPLDKKLHAKRREGQLRAAAQNNATAFGARAAAGLPRCSKHTLEGRRCKTVILADLIVDTLDLMCACGGSKALLEIRKVIPVYDNIPGSMHCRRA